MTTTSGLSWKIPGRVGDSPIIGAGVYVDQEVGAAGSTGRGEENIRIAGAHTIVENMRHGMTPKEACLDALKRIARNYDNDRARLEQFDINFYALRKDGLYAGARSGAGQDAGRLRVAQVRGSGRRQGAAGGLLVSTRAELKFRGSLKAALHAPAAAAVPDADRNCCQREGGEQEERTPGQDRSFPEGAGETAGQNLYVRWTLCDIPGQSPAQFLLHAYREFRPQLPEAAALNAALLQVPQLGQRAVTERPPAL